MPVGAGEQVCRPTTLGDVTYWRDDGPPCADCVRELHGAIAKMSVADVSDMLVRKEVVRG